ncbi:MAG: hypothetical protein J7L41_04040, partial [Synergistetes bacterium]|nr:hypothetical protein [Synergistota bacterium]
MEIPLNTGIDFLGNSIKLALGERIDSASLVYDSKRFVSLRYLFPDRTGVIDEIRFPEWMDEHPNVYSYGLYYRRGDSVVYPVRSHTERLGYFLVFADDSRETVDDLISHVYRDTILRVS